MLSEWFHLPAPWEPGQRPTTNAQVVETQVQEAQVTCPNYSMSQRPS